MNGIYDLLKGTTSLPLLLHGGRAWRQPSMNQEAGLTQHQVAQSQTSSLQNFEQ